MLDRYKSLIDQAKSAELETLSAWYSFFKMKKDPFLSPIPDSNTEFYTNQKEVIQSIIYLIGVASRGIPLTVLLVGCNGSGKSATLRYIKNVLNELSIDPSEKYHFDGLLETSNDLFQRPNELVSSDEEVFDGVKRYLELAKRNLDYLLVDNAKPAHIKTISELFTKTKLKLFAISPLNFEKIVSELKISPESKLLNRLSFDDALLMLNKRLKLFLPEKKDIQIFDLFEKKALKTIIDYCMGVPKLILNCVSKSMELAMQFKESPISIATAIKACKITRIYFAKENFEKVSKSKMEVLEYLINDEKTPTELSSSLLKDRSTISRHLNDLKEMELVTMHKRGRDSVYKITEPMKIQIELNILSQMRGKDATT
jgi:DNA-binding transcriptional ArsR family regulator